MQEHVRIAGSHCACTNDHDAVVFALPTSPVQWAVVQHSCSLSLHGMHTSFRTFRFPQFTFGIASGVDTLTSPRSLQWLRYPHAGWLHARPPVATTTAREIALGSIADTHKIHTGSRRLTTLALQSFPRQCRRLVDRDIVDSSYAKRHWTHVATRRSRLVARWSRDAVQEV
jgi:hypothetical protein